MVETQIASDVDGRSPVADPRVLRALEAVPRHFFVPESLQDRAYDDRPLPIGAGQTISQPYIVAKMTELLRLAPDSRVLEIGTGSGYQAAVLARLTPYVFTLEVVPALAERAAAALRRLGLDFVRFRTGDGQLGWPEEAPFDRLILTCATPRLSDVLWAQLAPGGRAVFPMGEARELQQLVVADKDLAGRASLRSVMPVAFVPLV